MQTTSAQFALYRQKNKAIVEITLPKDAKDIAHRSPTFKPIEFDGFRKQAGLNSVTITPKQWINRTGTTRIQTHLIPPELGKAQTSLVYASEVDVLNMALFGQTAAQCRGQSTREKGDDIKALL